MTVQLAVTRLRSRRRRRFPDEEGTEREWPQLTLAIIVAEDSPMRRGLKVEMVWQRGKFERRRRFPDEEGTESRQLRHGRQLGRAKRRRRFPDEEGTESSALRGPSKCAERNASGRSQKIPR